MKFSFSQTGGFAGLTRSLDLDTAALTKEDRAAVDDLLRPIDLFRIAIFAKASGPDMFHYVLRVADGDQKRELSFHDGNVPQELRPLLDFLMARAAYV